MWQAEIVTFTIPADERYAVIDIAERQPRQHRLHGALDANAAGFLRAAQDFNPVNQGRRVHGPACRP